MFAPNNARSQDAENRRRLLLSDRHKEERDPADRCSDNSAFPWPPRSSAGREIQPSTPLAGCLCVYAAKSRDPFHGLSDDRFNVPLDQIDCVPNVPQLMHIILRTQAASLIFARPLLAWYRG